MFVNEIAWESKDLSSSDIYLLNWILTILSKCHFFLFKSSNASKIVLKIRKKQK